MRNNQGFTLVEIIMVLVLAAILAIGAMARLPSTTLNLAAQAEQLASDIPFTDTISPATWRAAVGL